MQFPLQILPVRIYSKMKQEQINSLRLGKSISHNVLEAEVYYSSVNLLYFCFLSKNTLQVLKNMI
ncbi:hypothetical protein A4252_06475 [Streptococcus pneumoniae]|nr:hypothetical protein A4252_06475 [Streptococcus pneumoniae]